MCNHFDIIEPKSYVPIKSISPFEIQRSDQEKDEKMKLLSGSKENVNQAFETIAN